MPLLARSQGFGCAPTAIRQSAPAPWLRRRRAARAAVEISAFLVAAGLTAWSAVLAKQSGGVHALAESVVVHVGVGDQPAPVPASLSRSDAPTQAQLPLNQDTLEPRLPAQLVPTSPMTATHDPAIRWFNGRPVRPAKILWMQVTAYSPDARSCGSSADGLTATLHSVETNNSQLVAADPRILKYGSMVSVPGYASGQIVPVLDCGGAIKGNRLDLLFPTNAQAVKWGRKPLSVTVWEYADGKPAENPRKLR